MNKPRPCTCDRTVKDGTPYRIGRDCAKCYLYWNNPSSRRAMTAEVSEVTSPVVVPTAVPEPEWPAHIRAVALLRGPEDRGVGDTVANTLGLSGRMIKALVKATGLNCGCADRQMWLNQKYPYSETPT